MNNLEYSIPTLILCALGYYFSWHYYKKDNFTLSILLLMACGLALRVYASSDFFLHMWDERFHALVAKNLIEHPLIPVLYKNPLLPYDFKNWASNHIWLHKQPLPLWTMAASMWLFGVNEIALRLPSIILTTIGIWLTFYSAKYFYDKRVAYLSAFFYSVNGLIIEMTAGRAATDHIDIFFLFYIELAIFFTIVFVEKLKSIYTLFVGISIGLAILSKWLPALMVVPIWLLILIDSRKFTAREIIKHLLILIFTCLIVFLPWQLYILKTFPTEANWEASYNWKHFTVIIEYHSGSIYYYLNAIRINYGELIYLPLLWFLWKTVTNIHDKKRLAITIWVLVPLVFFSLAKTKMPGYILFIAPALFIMTSEFFFLVIDYTRNQKSNWFYNLILLLLILAPVRYMIERIKPFSTSSRCPQWTIDLRNLNNRHLVNGVLFNYDKPIEAMFYTNFTAYSTIPDKNMIAKLIANGYTVIINDDGKLPEDIKTITDIEIEKLHSR